MRIVRVVAIMGAALSGAFGTVSAQRTITPMALSPAASELSARYERFRVQLQPTLAAWVANQALVEASRAEPDLAALTSAVQARVRPSPNSGGMDIESVVFIVMAQAVNDEDQDLRAMMTEVQAQATAKQQLRNALAQMQQVQAQLTGRGPAAVCQASFCMSLPQLLAGIAATIQQGGQRIAFNLSQPVTANGLISLQNQLVNETNSMDQMSDTTSVRLQMAMDRRSRFYETLSNIEQKISATSESIVSNLK